MSTLLHSLSTFPAFAAYMGLAIALTVVYAMIYTFVTPHSEWSLLRKGNLAASLAFGGSLIGFVLPLASAIAHSESFVDCAIWGGVALVVQLLAFFLMRLLLPDLSRQIESDRPGPATTAALLFIVVGILNAACMVY